MTTMEHVIQMGPMLVLAGLVAGWMAETVSHAGGRGLILDMGIGLVGSLLVGGIISGAVVSQLGMLAVFVIGAAAGGLALGAQRSLWRSARSGA